MVSLEGCTFFNLFFFITLKMKFGLILLVIHFHAVKNHWNGKRFVNHILTSQTQGRLLVRVKRSLCPGKVYIYYQRQHFDKEAHFW